jgi:hypothetical protein
MIHYQTWPPQAILVSDWPIILKSSPLRLADNQHFQEPIEQSLEKSGYKIFTRYLPTGR